MHAAGSADLHISEVPLRNGIPMLLRLPGDWHDNEAFKTAKVEGPIIFASSPLATHAKETGDILCTLLVSKQKMQQEQLTQRYSLLLSTLNPINPKP